TQQVYDEIQAKMDKHYAEDIPMWPGVKELLQALKAAGKPCCIATMTDRPQVETVLKTHGIGEFFDFVLTTPEVGIGKERPEIFLQAAERFGCAPKRTLVVEDSRTAIRTALLAGFAVAVIPNPHYDYAPLAELAADLQADFCFVSEFSNLLPVAKN
ncbi:MAG: HAD-IA family hydrolase, partial [Firmicutes bacterium]|nr:HAD-IA family hydrolase [Bacillota bacterium]